MLRGAAMHENDSIRIHKEANCISMNTALLPQSGASAPLASDTNSSEALLLVGHGSRDPQWADPLRAVVARVRALRPATDVTLAFLELSTPTLEQAIGTLGQNGCTRIRVAPIFLGHGAHVKRDLARRVAAARAAHPGMDIQLSASAGESEIVLDAIAQWLANI